MISNAALLIIDVQNDFCPNGALAVPDGDKVVEPLRLIAENFANNALPVFASRDWHPATTTHFSDFGGVWPKHCIQDTRGAEFHPELSLPDKTIIISKGVAEDSDAYSAFEGRSDDRQSLIDILSGLKVTMLFVGGLATDYCVRSTVLDALENGFSVTVLLDAVAGVDLAAGDSAKAVEEMRLVGAEFNSTEEVLKELFRI